MPEIPMGDFDAEYRRAEIELSAELEAMLTELELAAGMVALPGVDFFRGGRGTALDVGCGIGTLPFLLAKRNPLATVIGVDVNTDSIAYAKEHYEPRADNLSFHIGSVDELSQMFSGINMITCIGALHHFPSLDSAIQQIIQTLQDDGAFFLSDLNRENLLAHFSAQEFRYLERMRRLPASIRNARLRLQGYTKGLKMRRFLTLMSFQAAYTPAEVAAALGPDYAFKGKMAGVNYLLVVNKKANS
jgi:2-polyprenyl-3-methyl-5-hydroxy-6-metoxy-1,4-benzoquinol methylase